MALRLAWISLLCLGCQTLVPLGAPQATPASPEAPQPVESAERLWDQGQDAMRHGHPDLAVRFYQRSL